MPSDLSRGFAVLHPLRDLRSWWPPDEVWAVLEPPQRLELLGGIALIVVTMAISVASRLK